MNGDESPQRSSRRLSDEEYERLSDEFAADPSTFTFGVPEIGPAFLASVFWNRPYDDGTDRIAEARAALARLEKVVATIESGGMVADPTRRAEIDGAIIALSALTR